jgi:hypothetical protein
MKNKLKNILVNNSKIRNSLVLNIMYLIYSTIRVLLIHGLRLTNINEYRQKKRSNVMVILGSGSSINELNNQQMQELEEYDVVGLSYSCILNIRQKFFFYECPAPHEKSLMEEHAMKVFPAILSAKKKGMIENIYWKNSENKAFEKYVDMTRYSKQIAVNVLTEKPKVFNEIIKWHNRIGLCKYILLQARGSVTSLLHLAAILKYKKIIFVGVDLNEGGYFFEHSDLYDYYNFGSPYEVLDGSKASIYRPNDPNLGTPIINFIEMMSYEMKDTSFFVTSKTSSLSSIFSQWEFKK